MYFLKHSFTALLLVLLICAGATRSGAQQPRQTPSPSPTPPIDPNQESVRVYTEEVRLPVTALDAYGHYDPTLQIDDVLVLEDGVAQQVRSVRHLPAHVMLLLDTGGETSGVGGMTKSTSLTRKVATNLVNRLPPGSWIAIMQSSSSAELLQPWTTDKHAVMKVLNSRLSQAKRSRISDTVAAAADQLKDRPEGARHVVMITDYVDTPGGKVNRSEAVKRLLASRATVHIISYTEFVRQKSPNKTTEVTAGMRPANTSPITATDPTMPPGQTRAPAFGVSVRFDPAMRKKRKAYESEVVKSQQVLKTIAEETGGKLSLPINDDQMLAESTDVARAITAEYVVSYRPKRPLAEAQAGEYRRIEVAARRVGLYLHSRKGYVVPTREN